MGNSPEHLAGSTQFAKQVVSALLGAFDELQKEPEDFVATLLSDQESIQAMIRVDAGDDPKTTEA